MSEGRRAGDHEGSGQRGPAVHRMKNEVAQRACFPFARHFLSVGTGEALLISPPAVIYSLLLGGER